MQQQSTILTPGANRLLAQVNSAAVVGLGDSGRSCIKYLDSKNIRVTAMDSRTSPPHLDEIRRKYSNISLLTGKFDAQVLLESDLVIVSPGISIHTEEISRALDAGVPVVGDIELFAFEVEKPVISITGSNGKSTVTALCAEMLTAAGLQTQVGGNFGRPALELLDEPAAIYVLELSSFQLETTHHLKSQVAVILNVTPDHMDRYESIDAYCAAKQRIFNNAITAVYNRDDTLSYPPSGSMDKIISFGSGEPVNSEDFGIRGNKGSQWLCQGDTHLIAADQLPLKGRHNQLNTLAAMAVVYLAGIDFDVARNGLMCFKGLPHRFEFIGEWGNVEWINDSKGTNPGATLASISGQHKAIILIVGGDAKDADFSILTDTLARRVKAVVLFGRDTDCIEKILPPALPRMNARNLDEVVQMADELAGDNDMVLFSPACASFDMFDNYKQRGDAFKNAVREYFQ